MEYLEFNIVIIILNSILNLQENHINIELKLTDLNHSFLFYFN